MALHEIRLRGLGLGLKESNSGDHAPEGVSEIADLVIRETLYRDLKISHADVFRHVFQMLNRKQYGAQQNDAHCDSDQQAQDGNANHQWHRAFADPFDVVLGGLACVTAGHFAIFGALAQRFRCTLVGRNRCGVLLWRSIFFDGSYGGFQRSGVSSRSVGNHLEFRPFLVGRRDADRLGSESGDFVDFEFGFVELRFARLISAELFEFGEIACDPSLRFQVVNLDFKRDRVQAIPDTRSL